MFADPIGSEHLRVSGGGGKSGHRKNKKGSHRAAFYLLAFPTAQSLL